MELEASSERLLGGRRKVVARVMCDGCMVLGGIGCEMGMSSNKSVEDDETGDIMSVFTNA